MYQGIFWSYDLMTLLLDFMKHSFDHLKWATQQNFNIRFSGINHNFFLGFYVIKFVATLLPKLWIPY